MSVFGSVSGLTEWFIVSPTGDMYLKRQGINPDELWFNELALGALTLGFMMCAYIALRCIKKEK